MIVFMTDWGNSHYVGICKGVIRHITDTEIIDLTHNIRPYSVRQAMYILDRSIDYFPKGTIFLCVVDHTVGTKRKPIAVKTDDYYFVAPDNGLLTLVLERYQPRKIVELSNRKYHFGHSKTFHGRDIFAPCAGYIAKGIFDELGIHLPNYASLPYVKAERVGNEIYGEIAYVDSFGNIETNIPFDWISDKEKIKVVIEKKTYVLPVVETYADVDEGQILIHEDSSSYCEIAINQGSANEKLKVKDGLPLTIIL